MHLYLFRTSLAGRTARMGAKGRVTSLLAKRDLVLAAAIEKVRFCFVQNQHRHRALQRSSVFPKPSVGIQHQVRYFFLLLCPGHTGTPNPALLLEENIAPVPVKWQSLR